MHRTVSRFRSGFLRDHQKTASRREVNKLLEDIESQLTEVTDETESMRSAIRLIRADFKLTEEPGAPVDDFEALVERLAHLTYEGVRAAQV